MIEALLALLATWRARKLQYESTAKGYVSRCHIRKRVEFERLAKVCQMHIHELEEAIRQHDPTI